MWWIWNLEKGVDKKIVNNKGSDKICFYGRFTNIVTTKFRRFVMVDLPIA